jgi:hypothetical protein
LSALAGALISVNVFVRFPNIVEVSLGAVILFDWLIRRRNRLKEVLAYGFAFLLTLGAGVLLVDLCFGVGSYVAMIRGLFSMTEEATSYSPLSMLRTIAEGYRWDIKYFVPLLVFALLMVFAYRLTDRKALKVATVAAAALFVLFILRIMRYWGSISFDYTNYPAIYSLSVLMILFSCLIGGVACLNRKADPEKRGLAFLVLLYVLVVPIGSNNGVYSVICCMFLFLPVAFGLLVDRENFALSNAPFLATVAMLTLALAFQGTPFRYKFVSGTSRIPMWLFQRVRMPSWQR